jgi:hypothetical protein
MKRIFFSFSDYAMYPHGVIKLCLYALHTVSYICTEKNIGSELHVVRNKWQQQL